MANQKVATVKAGTYKSGNLYGLCLFEVVDETNEFAYKYSDDIYISIFPSASLWFDDDYSWGWSTYKDNKPYNV